MFYWGTAVVKAKEGYGVIDRHGNEIIPCFFHKIFIGREEGDLDHIMHASSSYITVFDEKGNAGVYNRKGKEIVAIQEGQRISYDDVGRIHVKNGTGTEVIIPDSE